MVFKENCEGVLEGVKGFIKQELCQGVRAVLLLFIGCGLRPRRPVLGLKTSANMMEWTCPEAENRQ